MILVIDSGSFKADWVIVSSNKTNQFQTIGLNPYFITKNTVHKEIQDIKDLTENTDQIDQLFFYGAGCNSQENNTIIQNTMASIFTNAKVHVFSDLLGAARALFQKESGIACILGTGSNCCVFNGKEITEKRPALGYILGDEGSGTYMGKILLKQFLYGELPQALEEEFTHTYQLTQENILDALYKAPFPNRYLAKFTTFLHKHWENQAIDKIIYQSIDDFFTQHILKLHTKNQPNIRFTGSIAWHFRDYIHSISKKYQLNVDHISQSPVKGLIQYHEKEIT